MNLQTMDLEQCQGWTIHTDGTVRQLDEPSKPLTPPSLVHRVVQYPTEAQSLVKRAVTDEYAPEVRHGPPPPLPDATGIIRELHSRLQSVPKQSTTAPFLDGFRFSMRTPFGMQDSRHQQLLGEVGALRSHMQEENW
uniref:Uncharacterized protein n=1 Tax=Eutreptiella gymnastica TaxID=73025 RepID=A0A7S1J015_9EUGL